jgi:hypothetical protein
MCLDDSPFASAHEAPPSKPRMAGRVASPAYAGTEKKSAVSRAKRPDQDICAQLEIECVEPALFAGFVCRLCLLASFCRSSPARHLLTIAACMGSKALRLASIRLLATI